MTGGGVGEGAPRLPLRVKPGVLFKEVEDEAVLLDLSSERYYGLDGTATRMWELLTRATSIDEALAVLALEYDAAPERLRDDLCALAQRLLAAGLVDAADA